MRVFITGGTGYIGSAVVPALAEDGHEVIGLVRNAAGADTLRRLGAQPVLGELTLPASYGEVVAGCDAVIHTAVTGKGDVAAADKCAIDTFLAAASGGKLRSFVFTSGVWVLGNTGALPVDENAGTDHPVAKVAWRPAHELRVLAAATPTFSTSVVRPGVVYGEKRGLVSGFFASAWKSGAAEFVGDGKNHWSLVHREDLAEFYRLLLMKNARGIFHVVDGAPLTVLEIAEAASEAAGKKGATRSLPLEEARQKIGPVADALVLDQVVSGPRARELGWVPERASFRAAAREAYREWRFGNFDTMYAASEPPPWEIGRPQKAIVDLVAAKKVRGRVLDIGCGTGEHALYFAAQGHPVVGTDIAATAIAQARRKAADRKLEVNFLIDNALSFRDSAGPFDTVVDSGLFHVFDDEDRVRYVENLGRLVKPGGTLFVLCFSSDEPGEWGPRRVERTEFDRAFSAPWSIQSVDPIRYENFINPEGSRAWLATIQRE